MVSAMPTSAAVPARFPTHGDRDRADPLPALRRQRRLLPSRPSAELAEAARAGDTDAAGELYRRTHARARRAALVFCHEADADDAVAEGLSRALHRIDQLADPAAVEGWMVRCVVHAAVDLSRQRQRQRPSGDLAALTERALPAGESAADGALAIAERATMAAAVSGIAARPSAALAPPLPRWAIRGRGRGRARPARGDHSAAMRRSPAGGGATLLEPPPPTRAGSLCPCQLVALPGTVPAAFHPDPAPDRRSPPRLRGLSRPKGRGGCHPQRARAPRSL